MRIYRLDDDKGARFLSRLEQRRDDLISDGLRSRTRRVAAEIRRRGDHALLKCIRSEDLRSLGTDQIRVTAGPVALAEQLSEELRWALDAAVEATRRFHREHMRDEPSLPDPDPRFVVDHQPVDSVGVVIPRRDRPDLVRLIGALVPARLAGVPRLAVALSPHCFLGSASVRYLLDRLEVDDVYLMSGMHAVAALAFGTATVTPVDRLIAGGSAEVVAASQAVAGHVAVDPRPGIPELVVVADAQTEPDLIVSDLLAHLEGEPEALGLVLTTSARLAQRVNSLVRSRTRKFGRGHPVREALRRWSAILLADNEEQVCSVVDRIRPAMLEVLVREPERLQVRMRGASVVLLGPRATTALVGVAGVCAVLTSFGMPHGPLMVRDFLHPTCRVRVENGQYAQLAAASRQLSDAQDRPLRTAALTAGSRGED